MTTFDIRVGPFARECQITHLIGRVLRHVFDPAPDADFHTQEATQLERTLNAFMPLLVEEQTKFGLHCAALGMCSCALFTLYDSALISITISEHERVVVTNSIEETSTRIANYSKFLFGDRETVDISLFSPFVPLSLYQAAIVQLRMWKRTGNVSCKVAFDSLVDILLFYSKRWLVGSA